MATYETWFVANDAQLVKLFPGWDVDNPQPRPQSPLPVWNPPTATMEPIRRPPSEYLVSLEANAPGALRGLPHFCWKGSPFDLIDQLSAHLGWREDTPLLRKGPPDAEEEIAVVQGFPDSVLPALAAMNDEDMLNTGVEIEGAFDVDELEHGVLLLALRDLAKEAVRLDGHLCLFMTM